MSNELPKIVIAARTLDYEVHDLVETAARVGVPLVVHSFDDASRSYGEYEQAGVVYWRNAGVTKKFPKQVGRASVLAHLDRHVPIVNRAALDTPQYVYKSVQQARFKKFAHFVRGVSAIETFMASDEEAVRELVTAGALRFPFIAKPNFGMRGEGVELVKDEADIARVVTDAAAMVFQNFIPNNGDYRVFVVGGVAHDVMLRTASPSSKKTFLNNVSQGGVAQRVEDGAKRELLAKAGCAIAAMFNYTICGVDLIEDEEGNIFFLELNSVPQWQGLSTVTPRPVAEHILDTLTAVAQRSSSVPFTAVRDYFLKKLPYLPANLRFHFLSRLHLWSGGRAYRDELERTREAWWEKMDDVVDRLRSVTSAHAHADAAVSGKRYRRAAASLYPELPTYNNFFFKCLFDHTIFGGDSFAEHRQSVDVEHVRALRQRLCADPLSVLTLSTPAVNFLYFCSHYFGSEGMRIDPEYFLSVGDTQVLSDVVADVDARIYMYTHAIIGATRFYADVVPESDRQTYVRMLERVERIIAEHYTQTTLDHKCEFLVCCRLSKYDSYLESVIQSEVQSSCSPHGLYFVNTYNTHRDNPAKQSLLSMEHSNVLALMAFMRPEDV